MCHSKQSQDVRVHTLKWRKVVITAHGFKRLKHRCHISKRQQELCKKSIQLGFYKTLPDNINRYINSLITDIIYKNIRIYV